MKGLPMPWLTGHVWMACSAAELDRIRSMSPPPMLVFAFNRDGSAGPAGEAVLGMRRELRAVLSGLR